jgi:hypothetical protein
MGRTSSTNQRRLTLTQAACSVFPSSVRCGEPGSPAKAEKKMPPPSAGASEEVSIKCGGDTLVGVLHLPKNAAPHPAIIFIHGDGPTDHAAGGYYEPIWEEFLKAGYACLSWDNLRVPSSTRKSALGSAICVVK